MNLVTIKPQGNLKQVIKKFWYTSIQNTNGQPETYHIIGDGAPGIIFQHSNGHSAVLDTDGLSLPLSFAYGQSTKPCKNKIADNSFIFGVNFQPTALKTLFEVDTSELTNELLDIELLFSRQFNEQILNTSTPKDIVQLFEEKFSEHLSKKRQNNIVDGSLRLITQNIIDIEPKMLSSSFHLSKRQIQRKFKEYTGVCPETYIRIVKFQRAIHLLKNRQYHKLSDIGYGLNYADQSHFNREFKLFSGFTPKDFVKTMSIAQPFINTSSAFEPIRIVKRCV